MSQTTALFFANTISGVHAALIVFFLVGWLIPYSSTGKRVLITSVIAASFIFFTFFGGCPLTIWEEYFRNIAEPEVFYGTSYLSRNAGFIGFKFTDAEIDFGSFFVTLLIPTLAFLHWIFGIYFKKLLTTKF